MSGAGDGGLRVADAPERERYELTDDGAVLAFVQYRLRPGLIALVHTEVDGRAEGRGVGSAVVRGALDDARERGLDVLPFCPFVNGWMVRHREYADLVPTDHRAQFGVA